MDFIDEVKTRSARFAQRLEHLDTEEATKNALILPFIQMLGYHIFDPTEVVPEFVADVGTKRGEKVDYALFRDGSPALLVECKKAGSNLDEEDVSQLYRYFTATEARFGVLTNGVVYRFFSDLDQPNVMDAKPFFEFNMLDFTEPEVQELKKFTKEDFDLNNTLTTARELKYTREIKRVLADELVKTSDEFARFVTVKVFGSLPAKATRQRFSALVQPAFVQFLNDHVYHRLRSAIEPELTPPPPAPADWTSLDQDVDSTGKSPPAVIRFPDGEERDIVPRAWVGVLMQTALWLWKSGRLTVDNCQVPAGIRNGSGYIADPDGSSFLRPLPLEDTGLFLEGNLSSARTLSRTRRLLEHFGQDLRRVALRLQG